VPVGVREGYRDVLIAGIDAPPLAFRGREVRIEVTVRAYGYAGTAQQVLLRDSEGLVAAGHAVVNSDPWEGTVRLSFLPVEAGRRDLTITVPLRSGEAVEANNSAAVAVKVLRDKTRVLMVSGSPSLSYRFLRAALKNDPSVDLLSFVILRDPSDVLDVSTREQSLIPFPTDTLFSKELSSFDLLFFDNFDYSIFLNAGHLQSVRIFVESGGGFGVLGGPGLFPDMPLGENPIADILPVQNTGPGSYVRDGPVGVRMNSEGAGHPLMVRFSADVLGREREGVRFWNEMPSLDGINETNAKENAVVLLETTGGVPWPILTVSERGKGRVLALGTDYTWKWSMGMVARGEGNQPYLGLVHWIVRWLVRDPSLDSVQIRLPEQTVRAGEETAVRIAVLGGKPPGDSRRETIPVSFTVTGPDGLALGSRVERTPQPGEFMAYFRPEKGGIHRMEAVSPLAGAAESVVVAGPLDALDPAPDAGLLGRIAEVTGGELLSAGEDLLGKINEYAAKAERRYVEERRRPLWANPFAVAAVLGLLGTEWFLRRRWGLR
jgi:uncharacterized membrane protein